MEISEKKLEHRRAVVRGVVKVAGLKGAKTALNILGFDGKGATVAEEDGTINVIVKGPDGELISVSVDAASRRAAA